MARLILISNSSLKTQKIASFLAKEIIRLPIHRALVLALEGNLGSGKTTFTQGFARSLGIKENVLSPTFVLMKIYKIGQRSKFAPSANSGASPVKSQAVGFRLKGQMLLHLVHIDCYRIKSLKELARLGFKNLLKDKDAVILIEWADRIRKLVPKDAVWVKFRHGVNSNQRIIEFKT